MLLVEVPAGFLEYLQGKSMMGKLTDQPLAELIREISFKGLSGTSATRA